MILSRVINGGRVARDEVPSWIGAWGLVAADGALTGLVVFWAWSPVATWGADQPIVLLIGLMFAVFFIPIQGLMILSALWAAKARWAAGEPE